MESGKKFGQKQKVLLERRESVVVAGEGVLEQGMEANVNGKQKGNMWEQIHEILASSGSMPHEEITKELNKQFPTVRVVGTEGGAVK